MLQVKLTIFVTKWLILVHDALTPNIGLVTAYYCVLKGLAHAKIVKKSVILFGVLNMNIWCEHVHRLELQIFIIFVLRFHQLD